MVIRGKNTYWLGRTGVVVSSGSAAVEWCRRDEVPEVARRDWVVMLSEPIAAIRDGRAFETLHLACADVQLMPISHFDAEASVESAGTIETEVA
jgi:hypothetical protein